MSAVTGSVSRQSYSALAMRSAVTGKILFSYRILENILGNFKEEEQFLMSTRSLKKWSDVGRSDVAECGAGLKCVMFTEESVYNKTSFNKHTQCYYQETEGDGEYDNIHRRDEQVNLLVKTPTANLTELGTGKILLHFKFLIFRHVMK